MKQQRKQHRRLMALVLLTATAIGGIGGYKWQTEYAVPLVKTATVTREAVEETAICTGSVQAAESTVVYVSTPCVIGTVAVKEGDRVEAGDVLFAVDRRATLAMAVSAGMSEDTATLASTAVPETVTAPHGGVVRAVSATEGQTVQASTPCVTLSENGDVEIAVSIRERWLPKIAVGQEVTVSGVAFAKPHYRGTVSKIASSARSRLIGTASETVVDAVITLAPEDIDESLLVGLTAKAAVTVDRWEDVLLVPHDCVVQHGDGTGTVYVAENDTAVRTTVTLGKEFASGVQVTDGLREGQSVVCTPETLSGETVRVKTEAA